MRKEITCEKKSEGESKDIEGIIEGRRDERLIVGGDFNARTGREGGEVRQEEDEGEGCRESKDKKVNGEGRKLIRTLGELGLEIMNGGIEGDERGEYTYIGQRGRTVIDYVIGDKRTREGIESMVIEERVESDHLPVVLTMKKGQKEKEREIRKKDKKGAQRVEWGREGKEKFRRLTEEIEVTGEEIGERLGELERKIKSVIEEIRSTEGMKESKGEDGGIRNA
ncbi:uncharacterized protein LOC143363440 [Halictus rubicundus]|uniref:uncharacterized protein LOC143363440 n=1 Tax=Halictus rubicundus TaxID=77578 RepID=UPI0040373D2B